jgi:hypothetical protein
MPYSKRFSSTAGNQTQGYGFVWFDRCTANGIGKTRAENVTTYDSISRCFRLWIGLLFVAISTLGFASASPKRVLILNPFGRDVEPFSAAVSSFRTTLVRELGEPVDFHEIPLDLTHFTEPEGDAPLVGFLEDRIKSQPVDLVVPIGGAGARGRGSPPSTGSGFFRTLRFSRSPRNPA